MKYDLNFCAFSFAVNGERCRARGKYEKYLDRLLCISPRRILLSRLFKIQHNSSIIHRLVHVITRPSLSMWCIFMGKNKQQKNNFKTNFPYFSLYISLYIMLLLTLCEDVECYLLGTFCLII